MLVAFGAVEQRTGGQAEDAHQFEQRKAASGLLPAGLRISALVSFRIGQTDAGAIDDLDRKAVPEPGAPFGALRRCAPGALENLQGQALAGDAPGAIVLIDAAPAVEDKKRLNLADDLPARGAGIKHLVEKPKEGAPQSVDGIAAVGSLLGLGQEIPRQERGEQRVQVVETVLANLFESAAHGGQGSHPLWKEGSLEHCGQYIYGPSLDVNSFLCKTPLMTTASNRLQALEAEYTGLREQLADTGYLSKGSVVKRPAGRPGSRYQWTTKVKARTVSLTLSAEQYHWLKQAVANQKKLERLLQKMHRLSRKIMRLKFPNHARRNPLNKKVLRLI